MKTHRLLLLAGIPAIFFFSCTVEKRVYRPGYHVEWRNRQQTVRPEKQLADQLPQTGETPVTQQESVPEIRENNAPVTIESVVTTETTVPAKQLTVPVEHQVSREAGIHPVTQLKTFFADQTIVKKTDRSSTISQSDARNRAGLLLAPLRILFTILLIALVIVGVVLLFVLESALGGTVLLAAGAVLLILIIL